MIEKIKDLVVKVNNELQNITDMIQLNELKIKVFGKNGELTNLSKGMRDVPVEEKPKLGAMLNEARKELEANIQRIEKDFEQKELNSKLESEKVDITEPSKHVEVGALHPISSVIDRLTDICVDLGFSVVEGP